MQYRAKRKEMLIYHKKNKKKHFSYTFVIHCYLIFNSVSSFLFSHLGHWFSHSRLYFFVEILLQTHIYGFAQDFLHIVYFLSVFRPSIWSTFCLYVLSIMSYLSNASLLWTLNTEQFVRVCIIVTVSCSETAWDHDNIGVYSIYEYGLWLDRKDAIENNLPALLYSKSPALQNNGTLL